MDKNLVTLLKICSVFGIYLQAPKRHARIFRLYITILMGAQFMSCAFGILTSKKFDDFIISWAVSTIVFVSQILTHFIIMYEALSKQQEHTDFVRLLQDIDVYFKVLLRMDVSITKILQEIRFKLIMLAVISKVSLTLFAISCIIFNEHGYFWWALCAIFAMRFRFLQVITYVEILKYYILALNRKLNQVVCVKTAKSQQLLDVDYSLLPSIEIIRHIKHIYACLHEACTLVNEFAQASMFAGSASNFLDCTCHIYWTLLSMENLLSSYKILSSMVTILPLGLFVFKFCYICQVIKDENQRTSLLLLRLTSCGACHSTNRNYKNLVHDFSLQLMHQPLEFTGNHFFTFDVNCIFAICALIVTQLIILIQFTKNN